MALLNPYIIGQTITLRCEITDPVSGAPVTPPTVVCTVKSPTGIISTPSVLTISPGVFEAELTVNEPEVWSYRFEGTGTQVAVDEGRLYVKRSAVA